MILSPERDPRLVTVRRGGMLGDADHRLLALWAAACAEHVLPRFEAARAGDPRPRRAVDDARAWARGEVRMSDARRTGFAARAASREVDGAARFAALAAAQAVAVAHVAAHELGAAAYAIRAAGAAARESDAAVRAECRWQRDRLPDPIRDLVLDDQRRRNDLCWGVFGE